MWLSGETFRMVVDATPLVSIDLVVCDEAGQILLGQRLNRPAQGCWFVPGGRMLKNETLDEAFLRLTRDELGLAMPRQQARLLDVYEHFYSDSVFADAGQGPSTHYVVLGYKVQLAAGQVLDPPAQQHDRYRWWSAEAMQASAAVHDNSKAYLVALAG
jgi:colanic acid biosynthesis protein WcaH